LRNANSQATAIQYIASPHWKVFSKYLPTTAKKLNNNLELQP